jgi:UDP-glucose 4-epimerase
MKFLVTGGLGFVGNSVVRQLEAKGFDVCIIDNCNRISTLSSKIKTKKRYEIDITNKDLVYEIFRKEKPSHIIHLAAIHFIPECNENKGRTIAINCVGTQNIFDAAISFAAESVVFASSGAVYADSSSPLNEEFRCNPLDIYGISKKTNEQQAVIASKENKVKFCAVRLFNVYGPGETNPHIIPEIVNQLKQSNLLKLGNIDTVRDFIYVDDAARGFISLSLINSEYFSVYNLGSGNGITMRKLVDVISEITKRNIEISFDLGKMRPVDKKTQVANIDKLTNIIGEYNTISFEQGIRFILSAELGSRP